MLLLSHLPKSADSIDHLIENNLNLDAASILGQHRRRYIVARLGVRLLQQQTVEEDIIHSSLMVHLTKL